MSKFSLFCQGAAKSTPLILGGIPLGVIFGALAVNSGLTPSQSILMSMIVFAGSAQFISIGLFALDANIMIILLTTFMVNLRHILYSMTLVEDVKHLSFLWRIFLAFGLTDETFAVTKKFYDDAKMNDNKFDVSLKHWFYFGSIISFWLFWTLSTVLGVVLNTTLPSINNLGLDFAMYATFIAIVVSYLTHKSMWLCFILSALLALMFTKFPYQLGLTAAAIITMFVCAYYQLAIERRNK